MSQDFLWSDFCLCADRRHYTKRIEDLCRSFGTFLFVRLFNEEAYITFSVETPNLSSCDMT